MLDLLPAAIAGFGLGGGLIIAIGAQNAFILRMGLMRRHVFILCLVCALSDALLIALGVGGLGRLVAQSAWLITAVTVGGAAFLFVYGLTAFRRAAKPEVLLAAETGTKDLRRALAACLAFTFLNPHVYLDTVVLVGSLSAQYRGAANVAFAVGAMSASFVWFFALGYGARLLAPIFARPAAWRFLDAAVGIVMWLLAAGLLLRLASA